MFCALVVTVKRSVDQLFMHYFHNFLSASGGFAPNPYRGSTPGPCWRTLVSRPLIYPPLEKILRAPMEPVEGYPRATARISRAVASAGSSASVAFALCCIMYATDDELKHRLPTSRRQTQNTRRASGEHTPSHGVLAQPPDVTSVSTQATYIKITAPTAAL